MADKPTLDKGIELLKALVEDGLYIFTTDEAKKVTRQVHIPQSYLNRLLSRLVGQGWLQRLRRDLYVGTGSLPGQLQVHPFVISTRLVQPSAISHWSAMQHHGLTEQLPHIITAFTPKKVITPTMRAGIKTPKGEKHHRNVMGIQYEYISVKASHFFGIEKVWIDERFKVPITDKERTLLEGFVSPRYFGGLGEILGILKSHISEVDIEKIVSYALRYESGTVIKRLGWALEYLGVPLKHLQRLLKYPVKGFCLLDPTHRKVGFYDKRWMLHNNLIKR